MKVWLLFSFKTHSHKQTQTATIHNDGLENEHDALSVIFVSLLDKGKLLKKGL